MDRIREMLRDFAAGTYPAAAPLEERLIRDLAARFGASPIGELVGFDDVPLPIMTDDGSLHERPGSNAESDGLPFDAWSPRADGNPAAEAANAAQIDEFEGSVGHASLRDAVAAANAAPIDTADDAGTDILRADGLPDAVATTSPAPQAIEQVALDRSVAADEPAIPASPWAQASTVRPTRPAAAATPGTVPAALEPAPNLSPGATTGSPLATQTAASTRPTEDAVRDELDEDLLPVFLAEAADQLPAISALLRAMPNQATETPAE